MKPPKTSRPRIVAVALAHVDLERRAGVAGDGVALLGQVALDAGRTRASTSAGVVVPVT